MTPPKLLKSWNDWSAGIGYLRDNRQTPGMYTASAILGDYEDLRPAPFKNDCDASAKINAGMWSTSFFEEAVTAGAPGTAGASYLYSVGTTVGATQREVLKIDLRNATFGAAVELGIDLASGEALGQAARYKGKWYIGRPDASPNLKIYELTIIPLPTTSGDGANCTTTDTTLTDTDESWTTDEWIGGVITCNGKTMTVTDSDGDTVTGASWSGGGNPGNGNAWTMTGVDTWTTGEDGTGASNLVNLNYQLAAALTSSGVRLLKLDGTATTNADWGSFFQAGDIEERHSALASILGMVFSLNPVGLYSFNSTGRSGVVLEGFHGWRSPFKQAQMPSWNGGLLIPRPAGLLYYRPGYNPISIGPDTKPGSKSPPPGPTELQGGIYHGVAVMGEVIYCLYQSDISSTTALLLSGHGRDPMNISWQAIASITLITTATGSGHGIGTAPSGYPVSSEYPTPSVWVSDATVADQHLSYVILNSRASPFRPRRDTHKVVTSGDAYMSELFFDDPVKLSHFSIITQDMTDGDEWQISGIVNAGEDVNAGKPVIGSQRAERPFKKENVYRLMTHVNWKAESTADRIPPTIKRIELWGWE